MTTEDQFDPRRMRRGETLSTAEQTVTVRTKRGNLRIGPHGRIDGLWRLAERELRTSGQVRAMCAGAGQRGRESRKPIEKRTLALWRASQGFPAPVCTIGSHELWSRTEIEEWLEQRTSRD